MLKMLTEDTAKEAAADLGIPGDAKRIKNYIGRRLRAGTWPGKKNGKRWWFDVDEIRKFIAST